MAISSIISVRSITGLSTDDKPTDYGVGAGSTFFETDTNNEYVFNGASWLDISSSAGGQRPLIFQKLSLDGTATGVRDMAVDGSITPQEFYIQPPAGEVWRIARWLLFVEDGKGFDVGKWGAGLALVNGILVQVTEGGITHPGLPDPLKTSGDVEGLCYDAKLTTWGTADDVFTARWTLTAAGQFVRLVGDDGDRLSVTIRDDLSTLTAQYAMAQGYKEVF